MAPLLTFIGFIKGWHVIVVSALALLFACMSYFSDSDAMASARIQMSVHTAIAVLFTIFLLAFLLFASTTEKFGALALFPSIFVSLTLGIAILIIGWGLEEPDLPYPVIIVLALSVTLSASGIICGMIAIKQKLSR